MYSLTALCFFCAILGEIRPAAIPMWEYLSKDEKMSYLYSMFANQVDDFCDSVDMRNCNQELLKFGLNKLKDMPEDHLDTMDPYQRGAHSLIWDSMMDGHKMMNKHPVPRPTTTSKPNSYNDQSFNQDYQGQASAKIETVYRVPPPSNFVFRHPQFTMTSGPSQYRFPSITNRPSYNTHRPIYNTNYQTTRKPTFNTNYQTTRKPYVNNYQHDPMEAEADYGHAPLTGPMVVKVHLDGTPVKEQPLLPHDEDLRQYKMSKARLPSF